MFMIFGGYLWIVIAGFKVSLGVGFMCLAFGPISVLCFPKKDKGTIKIPITIMIIGIVSFISCLLLAKANII